MAIHPATNDSGAIRDLLRTLAREPMPSAGHVVALDLEQVSLNLDLVPLDEVLDFRAQHLEAYTAYRRDLQRVLWELASINDIMEREQVLLQRRQELADASHDLQRQTRRAFRKNLASWSLGLAGAVWSVVGRDPLGLALTAAGVAVGVVPSLENPASAYSYVFSAQHQLGQ
jgi:hypothetical protein